MAPPPAVLFPTSPASAMGPRSADTREKDKGVNVQVLLRCRPFNDEELRTSAPQVVSCNEHRREVSVNMNIAAKQIDRTFTFDKVFGPNARQQDLYEQAIVPIVNEVLEGFNCTIFAYGQTGTGKTFTMEGSGRKPKDGGMPTDAGVIPRAVQQIVDTLEAQNAEYSMKVTFLELYNEEITDLLAPDDVVRPLPVDDRQPKKPLALMEDGKGGVLVRGLEEEIVYSANEIYTLLERGTAKRRTAETLLNKQSSRSHSIFSITIHIKEATPEGEELLKCGKLNLVDLAGSENISRSGARDGRAREAGEINKSLLTLGRVITALVEHLGHIPYRDSKLTRLLRDSLGGKTKTCIIATVSPSVHCLEETLSTLDYAHRAKNIKNKPELNQKMHKTALIKDLYSEMERLKAEINAAREKNGVYLPRERYLQEEAEKKAMGERIEQMEFEIETKNKRLESLQDSLDSERCHSEDLSTKLENNQKLLRQTQEALNEAKSQIVETKYTIREKEFIISKFQQSEDALVKQATNLQSQLEHCAADIAGLHSKIERKSKVEMDNQQTLQAFHDDLNKQLKTLHESVLLSVEQQQNYIKEMQAQMESFMITKTKMIDQLREKSSILKEKYFSGMKCINELAHSHERTSTSIFQKVNGTVSSHSAALEEVLSSSVLQSEEILQDIENTLNNQQKEICSLLNEQRQKAQLSIDATKEISSQLISFFEMQNQSGTDISVAVSKNHDDLQKRLEELESSYKELSKQEENMLMQKVAEIVASAMARKEEMVTQRIHAIRDTTGNDVAALQQDLNKMQEARTKSQRHWEEYSIQAESQYNDVCDNFNAKKIVLEENIDHCAKRTKVARDCWKQAQESVQALEKNNHLTVDLIVKEGVYGNGVLLTNLEEINDNLDAEMNSGHNILADCINENLTADEQATSVLLERATSQCEAITTLQSSHNEKTTVIQSQADACFTNEFSEDVPTGITPTKKPVDAESKEAIEALRAPSLDRLAEEFKLDNKKMPSPEPSYENDISAENPILSTPKGATLKESKIPIFADSSLLLKDNRAPLATVN
uniref:Kinesin 5c protein n=1 Tax=Marsilea vestita TaxID=59764 RepID=A0A142KW96_MARVE|nr:kinesin 5c protein [Marsilea vestita]